MSSGDILRVTILGCGPSGGVPRIGGDWGACDPDNPRNKRSRSSILVERGAPDAPAEARTSVLIDTSPDLRSQLLAAEVGRIDAVLYTHDHADQCHGIDDLRVLALRMRRRVPVYMDARTAKSLHARFGYCFEAPEGALYPPILDAKVELRPGAETVIDGPGGPIAFTPIEQEHGPVNSLGFRFGAAAYSNDVSALDETALAQLAGVKLWVVDALRYKPHISHAHLALTLDWIEAVKPARALLTNLNVELDYETVNRETPDHVEAAYDGLVACVPAEADHDAQVS